MYLLGMVGSLLFDVSLQRHYRILPLHALVTLAALSHVGPVVLSTLVTTWATALLPAVTTSLVVTFVVTLGGTMVVAALVVATGVTTIVSTIASTMGAAVVTTKVSAVGATAVALAPAAPWVVGLLRGLVPPQNSALVWGASHEKFQSGWWGEAEALQ